MAVQITKSDGRLAVGEATELFSHPGLLQTSPPNRRYDVTADGHRFLIVSRVQSETPPQIRVVQNWYEEFRDGE